MGKTYRFNNDNYEESSSSEKALADLQEKINLQKPHECGATQQLEILNKIYEKLEDICYILESQQTTVASDNPHEKHETAAEPTRWWVLEFLFPKFRGVERPKLFKDKAWRLVYRNGSRELSATTIKALRIEWAAVRQADLSAWQNQLKEEN